MAGFLRFVLSNFSLTFFVAGLSASAVSLANRSRPLAVRDVVEALFAWFLFFSIGVSFAYNFVCHVFFGETAARFIGWAPSPFQTEVGMASLGFSVVGFLAFFGGFELRLAAVVGPACFLWGAAAGHVWQMLVNDNYSPGNAGVIFITDCTLPAIGLGLLWLQRSCDRKRLTP